MRKEGERENEKGGRRSLLKKKGWQISNLEK